VHDIRILTLNCWNGRADPRAIGRLLEERSIDAACFQELAPPQAEAIGRVLGHGKLSPSRDFRGQGIALRFEADVLPVPIPRRDAWAVDLAPSDWPQLVGPLQILGVHLQAPHVRPWASLPLRRAQVKALRRWLAQHPATHRALAGDLNATPLWPAYRALAREFEDAARAGGARPRPTWGPTGSAPRLLRIDHVLTRGLDALACEVVHVPGADHSALIVDLRLRDDAP